MDVIHQLSDKVAELQQAAVDSAAALATANANAAAANAKSDQLIVLVGGLRDRVAELLANGGLSAEQLALINGMSESIDATTASLQQQAADAAAQAADSAEQVAQNDAALADPTPAPTPTPTPAPSPAPAPAPTPEDPTVESV